MGTSGVKCDFCYGTCTGMCIPHAVDQPKHYARWKIQPIEFIEVNELPWWMANVVKYIMRHDAKDGLKDLYKARSYLDMKIQKLEGFTRWWETDREAGCRSK